MTYVSVTDSPAMAAGHACSSTSYAVMVLYNNLPAQALSSKTAQYILLVVVLSHIIFLYCPLSLATRTLHTPLVWETGLKWHYGCPYIAELPSDKCSFALPSPLAVISE